MVRFGGRPDLLFRHYTTGLGVYRRREGCGHRLLFANSGGRGSGAGEVLLYLSLDGASLDCLYPYVILIATVQSTKRSQGRLCILRAEDEEEFTCYATKKNNNRRGSCCSVQLQP